MTNTVLLKNAIRKSGLKLKYIAVQLKISPYSLYRKIENRNEFRGSEIRELGVVLHLSSEEIEEIFLDEW